GQRVATDRTIKPGASAERQPLQSDSRVAYPAHGGFGTIFEALAGRCRHIELGQEVVHIDLDRRRVHCRNGRSWPWRRIVSTLPLPELLRSLSDCPPHLMRLATGLQAVSLKVLLLLVRLRDRDVPQRVYIADPAIPPHKVAFN